MAKRRKYIVCPHCKEKINSVVEWTNTQRGYVRDLTTGDTLDTKDDVDSEFDAYACPECNDELPGELYEKINKFLWEI